MSADFGKPAAPRLVAENESYDWGNLTLAVQLLLPLALVALLFAKKKIWIYPYPLLDGYISALCPSFSQQQRLLKWMSSRIPHMNSLPNKITQYWQNGSLLCTLINTVIPGACSNPQKHWKKPPTHGQALAYKYLGVVPILTEDDFSKQNLTSCSERKFIKYLLSVQDAINKVTVEEDSLKFTSKYLARGMGLVIGEQNRPSCFYVYPNNGSNKIKNVLVNVKGPYNTFGAKVISNSDSCANVNHLIKQRKEIMREQQKLEYKSKAQRSFFRSVSFDIGPIMNLVTNRRNSGEISVKVEMENERAKVTFLPKFSGIYELLLTNDGQHLQGSPFVIRIMKNTKEVEDVLQEKVKLNKVRIERKIIGKSIDFINESVNITDFSIKLDSNNNPNACKEPKEASESNKSDDESVYQDSGIFDENDQSTNRSRQFDLEEIDEDSKFSEISDTNTTDDSKHNSLEITDTNISSIIEVGVEKKQVIIVHNHTPDDIKFLTRDFEQQLDEVSEENLQNDALVLKNGINDEKLEEEIFDNADDTRSNQEFENLYNRYINDDTTEDITTKNVINPIKEKYHEERNADNQLLQIKELGDSQTKEDKEIDILQNQIEKLQKPNDLPTAQDVKIKNLIDNYDRAIYNGDVEVVSSTPHFEKGKRMTSSVEKFIKDILQNQIDQIQKPNDLPTAEEIKIKSLIDNYDQTIKVDDSEAVSSIPQFEKGRRMTSSVEKIVGVFENEIPNKQTEKQIHLKLDFTCASPVFSNIAQEATRTSNEIPMEDSLHLERDAELSSKEPRPILTRDYSMFSDDDEVYDTNVSEIKNIFERKQEVRGPIRRFATTLKKRNGLEESNKKFAKSLPNLASETVQNSLEACEDEFLVKFKEKRDFWNSLISENSTSSLNVSTVEINLNNTKLISKQYQNVSQSANSLHTRSPLSKFRRRKDELFKTTSLDFANTYDDEFHVDQKGTKITRAQSLYDRIRIFEKDFDSSRHSTLLRRTKAKSDLKDQSRDPEVTRPVSLTEVPNTTSNDQIEEDLRFAEIMKERFEISRKYFCSLESGKPNLARRHSMDSKPEMSKDVPLQKGGSLKVLNVVDKFSLDNIYKDVILNKMKNSCFKGSPNRDAIVETLSSVSSSENNDFDKDKSFVEEEDLNLQFFNIKKRLRKRRSIKSIFDVNY